VERPPATLCQHKLSQCCRVSARQHRDKVLTGDLTSTLARSLFYHYTTHSYASISGFHYTHIIPHSVNCFLGSKWFQIKNLSTTKFHNFLSSTTLMLGVFPFEVVYKIWISNLRDSNLNYIDNMISNKKT
jgi:hypothetical protein